VVNTGLDSLSAVDLMSGQVVATAAAGGGALHVAVSPDGQLAYVTNQTAGTVSVFDTTSMELVTTIEGLDGAMSVTFEERGRKAYVTAGSFTSGQLYVINTSDHSVAGNIRVGANPVSVRLGPYGNFLFVANQGAGSISIIDVETETVTQTVSVGALPSDVAPVL
jgi:YVTN family beta-propeller protein